MTTAITTARNLLRDVSGYAVARSIYSVSETGTMANHSIDLVDADDIDASLNTADAVSSSPMPVDDAVDIYASAPGAEARESYTGYSYTALTVRHDARGYSAGTEATYIIPVGGW